MRSALVTLLALAAAAALCGPASAIATRQFGALDRALTADTVVIGRITAIENDPVPLPPAAGAKPVEYRVAVVQVSEALAGAKGLTHLRVAFLPPVAPPPQAPNGSVSPPLRDIVPPPRLDRINLTTDLDGCFFLVRHPASRDLLTIPPACPPLDRKSDRYTKDLPIVKRGLAVIADPLPALEAKEPGERFAAAAVLVQKYRVARAPGATGFRPEPIDARESRLILRAISEADWAQTDPATGVNGLGLFQQLQITAQDGFAPPATVNTPQKYQEFARQWVGDHADTYRIQRLLPGPAPRPR
jgi:hypothetical protein